MNDSVNDSVITAQVALQRLKRAVSVLIHNPVQSKWYRLTAVQSEWFRMIWDRLTAERALWRYLCSDPHSWPFSLSRPLHQSAAPSLLSFHSTRTYLFSLSLSPPFCFSADCFGLCLLFNVCCSVFIGRDDLQHKCR